MSKKISLGVAATIAIIAMAVTFSLTMVVSMKMFNTTVSSVKNKERQYNKLSEIDRFVRAGEYFTIDEDTLNDRLAAGYMNGINDKYAVYYTALSGRFEIWHNVFWSAPLSLLGGLPTDGDEHHAIDNTFLAVPMNKGLLGAILVAAVFLLLLWRLAKKHRSTEVICLAALTLYLFMENKPFLLSANPFLLMLPVVFFNAETGKAQQSES